MDVYAPDWDHPARIEFFGDEIDSIRTFDVSTQRSVETHSSIEITLLDPNELDQGFFTDFLPDDSWFFLIEPMELEDQARGITLSGSIGRRRCTPIARSWSGYCAAPP